MKSIVLLSALTVCAGVAFADPAQTTPPSTSPTMPNTTPATPVTTTTPSANPGMQMNNSTMNQQDGQVVQTLMVIDMNEINAAKEALKKSTNPSVKKFAKEMEASHNSNLEKAKKLGIAPVSSDKTMALQKKGQTDMTQLMALNDKSFDAVYITAMVNGHQEVLAIIDSDLLRNTNNPKLIQLLKSTRSVVEHHLQMAKEIQKKLATNKT